MARQTRPFPAKLLRSSIAHCRMDFCCLRAGDAPPWWHKPAKWVRCSGCLADELAGTTWRRAGPASSRSQQRRRAAAMKAGSLPSFQTQRRFAVGSPQHVESAGLMRLRVSRLEPTHHRQQNDRWLFMVIDVSPQHAIEQEGRRSETAPKTSSVSSKTCCTCCGSDAPVLPIHEGDRCAAADRSHRRCPLPIM